MYKVYFVRATAYRARFICHRQFPSVELPSWRFLVKVGYLAKDDSYDVSFKKIHRLHILVLKMSSVHLTEILI